MKASRGCVLSIMVLSLLTTSPAFAGMDRVRLASLARAEVPFVENRGQLPDRVAFTAATPFGTVFVTHDGELQYSLADGSTLRELFVSGHPRPVAGLRGSTDVSYFRGSDPAHWQTSLATYGEVELGKVWPGVSVSLHAHGGTVEKILTILPRARSDQARLCLRGATSLRVDRNGALIVRMVHGEVRFTAPIAYQWRDGRHRVSVAYELHGSTYGFRLGRYDRTLPLVIDPILQSTYVGGAEPDSANAIAVDPSNGDVLVAGHSYSNAGHGVDGFVARFDSTLQTLLHFTYLGGSGGEEILGVAVHPVTGEVYVAGFTSSTDFPRTHSGAQPESAGSDDGFVARLDPTLTQLLGATYFGGDNYDKILGVAIHPGTGEVYVAGNTISSSLPGTSGGAQPAPAGAVDGFIARFDPALGSLIQATYLGGGGPDFLRALALDPRSGDVYVAGQTLSTGDFPATEGGANAAPPGGNGNFDAFVARLDPSLRSIRQATFLGSAGADDILGIAVHPSNGVVYVTGWTDYVDFPATAGGPQPALGGEHDGFVARLNPALTTLFQSTYLGGSDDDFCYGIAVHPENGDVYVTGETFSTDLPGTSGGAEPEPSGGFDGFVTRLDPTLTRIVQSTYLGASGDDTAYAIAIQLSSGETLVAGTTSSTDFPETFRGEQSTYGGGSEFFGGDGFVARLTPSLLDASRECALNPDTPCLNGREPIPIQRVHSPRTVKRPDASPASGADTRPF